MLRVCCGLAVGNAICTVPGDRYDWKVDKGIDRVCQEILSIMRALSELIFAKVDSFGILITILNRSQSKIDLIHTQLDM